MTDELPSWMRRALSDRRLAPYLVATGGDEAAARRLYWWNAEVSGAFLGPLHCLELTLRNALHTRLQATYGRPDWWVGAPLNSNGRRLVEKAIRKRTQRRGATSPTADDVMAELSFGFWVSLLSAGNSYDRRFWVPSLHRAFPHYSGRRDALHQGFESMVLFRNRIGHHEPIHHRHLAADHGRIFQLLEYLSPDMAAEAGRLDRVPAVLKNRDDTCRGIRPPQF